MTHPCPCGNRNFDECCGPFLRAEALPLTAEALMRSRYCAFVLGNADHLFRTWHPRTRPDEPIDTEGGWLGLQILDVVDGGPDDEIGIVEFIAFYDGGQMRERSRFVKRAGRWLYEEAL